MMHPDSPSPISSQNSTSGDENRIYNRSQQQHKKKSFRNSLGKLFTRKSDSHENKFNNEMTESTTGTLLSLGKSEFDRRIKKKFEFFPTNSHFS